MRLAAGRCQALSFCRIIRRNLTLTTPHQTTHCPRDTAYTPLHSSQWLGTSSLQLRDTISGQLLAACPVLPPPSHTVLTACSWVFRENNVPQYQKYFQKNDGLRTWEKVRLS